MGVTKMIQNDTIQTKKNRKFTLEEEDKIYDDRFKFSDCQQASYHKTNRFQIKRIKDKVAKRRGTEKLTNQDLITIATAKAPEIVSSLLQNKANQHANEIKEKDQELQRKQIELNQMTADRKAQTKQRQLALDMLDRAKFLILDDDPEKRTQGIVLMDKASQMLDRTAKQSLARAATTGVISPTTSLIDNRQIHINDQSKHNGSFDSIVDYQFSFPILQDSFKTIANDVVIEAEIVN
jgi:hypothetical protein